MYPNLLGFANSLNKKSPNFVVMEIRTDLCLLCLKIVNLIFYSNTNKTAHPTRLKPNPYPLHVDLKNTLLLSM